MSTRLSIIACLLLMLLGMGATRAEMVVVAHPDIHLPNLSRPEVADLFLGRRQVHAEKGMLAPVDIDDEILRDAFYKGLMGLSVNRVRAYWAQQVFSGRSRPPREMSVAEAINRLQQDRLMLVYLPAEMAPPGSRVVLRLP